MRRLRHAALLLLAAPLTLLSPPVPALASSVALSAGFEPDVLGQSTTILYKFSISQPQPVRRVTLHLPAGMELATSSLGLSECATETLRWESERCPANSLIGRGTAFAEVPLSFQPDAIQEPAKVTAVLGPPEGEEPIVLFLVEGVSPVFSTQVLPSRLATASGKFSATLTTEVPLLQTWPEGPFIALTHFQATIGPLGLTYYRREHGHLVSYHPKGLTIPSRCPRKGFLFRVEFAFYNGTQAAANSYAPCPSTSRLERERPKNSSRIAA